ncbi:nitrate- and nitrite sensing domain-containing protein [Streptomyces hoynatensis]|uniref:histidine kinase n=1 Tax=Streptomyces hoynatensis TaxID=1141874 RepID=A0A3A9YY82_9ACTN|nr:nitrate- and nitrite sensing domain-containing protein [Streptomyces hoynatensis]RKN40719.1 HAMP domain-containing protein [Streptomyces hoynatensis]
MQGRFKRDGSAAGDAEPGGGTDRDSSAGPAPGSDQARPAMSGEQPARDHAAEEAAEGNASPAPSRPSRAGSRLALRNWHISTRLVSLIALPVVAATIMGGLRMQTSMEKVDQLDDMQLLTDMTQQATLLAAALQEERDRSAGPLITGKDPQTEEVAAPRERTNEAMISFSDATLHIDGTDENMRGVQATVIDIGRSLNQISQIRNQAYEDPNYISQTVIAYDGLIEALLNLSLDMAQATSNGDMIRSTRALAAFSSAKEHASIQRAIITAGLARQENDGDHAQLSDADWRYGRTHQQNEEAQLDSFAQLYGDGQKSQDLLRPLEGGLVNVVSADDYARQVFAAEESIQSEPPSYPDWFDDARTKIDAMNDIEAQLLDEMQAQAQQLQDEAEREAIINGVIVLLVLGISLVGAFIVARSMVRSLRRLQHTAQEVARKRLPEVVRRMSEAEPEDVDTSVEPVGVYTRDEIGRVAQAFDDVHREAVRLAGEQALLRGNVNAMFTNLSRRSQGLIQRQLSLISELESREADPDQLSSLFKLDHLATRMRRNGENLLVLAGEEPGRRWTRPVPLVDVLRAAASEVEQYERIELSAVPKTDVAGRVVNDLVHLLAELLENATSFSSPQTKVKVTGHALPDGRVLVEIHDTGIGLSPEDLAEINDRLANPPTVDVSVSRRMGLFVVGRLSLRHGIRIQLRPSDSGGTTALVMLPADVAQGARPQRPGAAAQGGPATHTVEREAPPQRRAAAVDSGPDTAQLPGWQRSLERSAAEPIRGQSSGRQRPALPPRQPAPAAAESEYGSFGEQREAGDFGDFGAFPPAGPGPQPAPERPLPGAAPAGRPSWASSAEDSGRIPVAREAAEQPRGHDESETSGEFPRPTAGGAAGGRSALADAFSSRQRPARQPAPQPAPQLPDDTTEFGFPGQRPGTGQGPGRGTGQDTGEYPAPPRQVPPLRQEPQPQQRRPAAPEPQPQPSWRPDELRDPLPAYEPQRAPERTPIFEEMETTWFGTRRSPVSQAPPSYSSAEGTAPAGQGEPRPAAPRREPRGEIGQPWRSSPNDERWRQAEQLRQPSAGGVTNSGLPRRVPRANLVAGAASQQQQQAAQAGPSVSRRPDDVRGRLTNLRRGIQQGRQAGSSAGRMDRGSGPTYQ